MLAKAYVCTMSAAELWEYFVETEQYELEDGMALRGFMPGWIGEFYAFSGFTTFLALR